MVREREKVKYFFSAADLVVQPYRHATQSGVTQVAYQFDVPMIVTNVGGLAEIVHDGVSGFVVSLESNTIADAIFHALAQDVLVKLREGVKQEKNRFTWSAMVNAIEHLSARIIGK